MSLYSGSKTRVRVDFEWLDEFDVKLEMHQGSVVLAFICKVVVDVAELIREYVLSEILYADDLVLMSELFEGNWNKFRKLKENY